METKVKVLPPEMLMEELLPLLEEVKLVPLVITGNSMVPFLVGGRDTVFLSKVTDPLKMGDMILYQRSGGEYILHRIRRVNGDSYTLVGDAHPVLEPGIRPDQVRAVVKAVRRKGKVLEPGSFLWDFFEKVWIRLVPVRPLLIGGWSALTAKRRNKRREIHD